MFSAFFKHLSWDKRILKSHKTSLQLDKIYKINPEKPCSKKRKKSRTI